MANNRFQIKRTSVSGRLPNTTSSGNSSYIAAGELALNLTDGILYSSNGSVIIPVGANNVNVNVSGNLTVNTIVAGGSSGTNGQVLTTDGNTVYWATPSSGSGILSFVSNQFVGDGSTNTYVLSEFTSTNSAFVFINGVEQISNGYSYTIVNKTLTFSSNIPNTAIVDVKIPITSIAASNNVTISNTYAFAANNLTTSNTSQQYIDSFEMSYYRSASYFVQVTDNTNNEYHAQNITLIHNGSAVSMVEFGAVYTSNSLAVFDATISSNTVYLQVTPVTANSTIRVARTAMVV